VALESFMVVAINCELDDIEALARPIRAAGGVLARAIARNAGEIIAAAKGARAIVIQRLMEGAAEVFGALPELRVVGRMGIGLDSIDLAAAAKAGVAVVNVPSFCEEEVCDHAMALLLACARRVAQLARATRQGAWDAKGAGVMFRLRGRTLGLVGLGKIPVLVAARARAFGLKVVAFDPYAPAKRFEETGVEAVALDALLRRSDYVSIHCPLTVETRGLINAERLALMKPDAFLINTARGGIVDEGALVEALRGGRIAGAALDVMAPEPPGKGHPLLDMDNVIVTPHAAFYSEEAVEEVQRRMGERIVEALGGGEAGRAGRGWRG